MIAYLHVHPWLCAGRARRKRDAAFIRDIFYRVRYTFETQASTLASWVRARGKELRGLCSSQAKDLDARRNVFGLGSCSAARRAC